MSNEFSPSQIGTLSTLKTIASSVSIIGSMAVFFAYQFSQKFRSSANQIIFFIIVADLFSAIARIVGTISSNGGDSSIQCQSQAFVMQLSDTLSILYSASISTTLLLILYFKKTLSDLEFFHRYFHGFVWSLSFAFAITPMFINPQLQNRTVYGDADLWCWITGSYFNLQLGLFFIPLWLTFVYINVTSSLVWRYLYKKSKNDSGSANKSKTRIYMLSSLMYAAAFFITWFPGTVNRISISVTGTKSFELAFIQALFSCLRGFSNSVAFFIGSKLKMSITDNAVTFEEDKKDVIDIPASNRPFSTVVRGTLNKETLQHDDDSSVSESSGNYDHSKVISEAKNSESVMTHILPEITKPKPAPIKKKFNEVKRASKFPNPNTNNTNPSKYSLYSEANRSSAISVSSRKSAISISSNNSSSVLDYGATTNDFTLSVFPSQKSQAARTQSYAPTLSSSGLNSMYEYFDTDDMIHADSLVKTPETQQQDAPVEKKWYHLF